MGPAKFFIAHHQIGGGKFAERNGRPQDITLVLFRLHAAFFLQEFQPLVAADLEPLREAIDFHFQVLRSNRDVPVRAVMFDEPLVDHAFEHVLAEPLDARLGQRRPADVLAVDDRHHIVSRRRRLSGLRRHRRRVARRLGLRGRRALREANHQANRNDGQQCERHCAAPGGTNFRLGHGFGYSINRGAGLARRGQSLAFQVRRLFTGPAD